jgi:Ca2+-binding RTX toxin-like protein
MIMATLSFSVQYDMSTATAWNATVTAHDKSSLTIESLPLKATYTSSGGSLKYANGSTLPSSGTISGVKQWDNDVLQYELSGGKLSVAKILGYLNTLDAVGLQQFELSGNDRITGSLDADVLLGWAGNDVLDGGKGADRLQGGKGNDTYVVDNVGDVIVELANEGTDLVQASVDFSLSDNVENLTLTGIDNINATGNALKNKLIGNDGDNILDGGGDKDSLIGGKGDDSYIVDLIKRGSSAALEDKITEKSAEGTDSLVLRVAGDLAMSKAATLKLAANLENIDASDTGSNLLNLTGNNLDNKLTGNTAANILDGGAGADTLIGGAGDDTYIIDNTSDTVTEDAAGGTDLVKIKISTSGSYTLGDNIENATLISAVNFDVIGNAQNNVIMGNSKKNTIQGGAGADTLDGGAGEDTVSYADSADSVTVTLNGKIPTTGVGGDAEGDTLVNFEDITGSAFADTLTGDATANVLDGGAGADTLIGGDGNDIYIVDNTLDVVIETNPLTKGGIDWVQSSVNFILGDNIENLTLTANADINGTGNSLNNKLIGNSGNNTLDGGSGKDTLIGGDGDDIYIVDNVGDVVTETNSLAGGIDLVNSSVNFTLGANIEKLTLTGTDAINGTGNALNNVLTGNTANNVLDGGAGADALFGGAGDDTYLVDNVGDSISEDSAPDSGIDLVKVNITTAVIYRYSLPDNVENATLISGIDFDLIGNSLKNILIGNAKNNVIEGGSGADTLDGGAGSDTVSYEHSPLGASLGTDGSGNDLGTDKGVTVSLTGSAFASGSGGDAEGDQLKNFENIIGSANNDTLTGDANANVLDGGAGVDHMSGGDGNDTYVVDNILDVVSETNSLAAGGIDLVQSSVDFTLGVNLENLRLTGTAFTTGKGNELDNMLFGNAGDNQLYGYAGNDTLDGGAGADTLVGGKGNDTYHVDLILNASSQVVLEDTITEYKDEGTDSLMIYNGRNVSSSSAVLLTLGSNLENMDASHTDISLLNLVGNALNNVMIGNSTANTLDGGTGNDTLYGGDGADTLIGGDGADILSGGAGKDTLTGGIGADIFNFDTAPSTSNVDHITDFSRLEGDTLSLSLSQFPNIGTAGNKLASTEFYSSGTLPTATATQHIVYNTSTGDLYYNADGSGTGGLVLIGTLDGHPTLSAGDISLI